VVTKQDKTTMKTPWALRPLRVRDVLALILFVYVLNYLITPEVVGEARLVCSCRPHFNQKFDSGLWHASGLMDDGKNGKESPTFGERYKMVDELLTSNILNGMGEDEVLNALGRPDAGLVDKKSLAGLSNLSVSGPTPAQKEILDSPHNIAIWSYHLAYQSQFPAKSVWNPVRFYSGERWKLLIKMKNGKVFETKVSF